MSTSWNQDKAHILSQIQRVAAESGRAPGRRAFESRTGIREADWQRHWLRWGDALKEAGFSPNEMNSRSSNDHLLEKLVALIREKGHYPVDGELRWKRREDPTFPSHGTFRNLGTRSQVLRQLLAHCQSQGYQDVIEKLPSVPVDVPVDKLEKKERTSTVSGVVYLLKSGKHYKIGYTSSIERRHRDLAIQLPTRPDLVHQISTDDPVGIEAYWHKRFESKRKNGEWFELTVDDVRAFRRRKFM